MTATSSTDPQQAFAELGRIRLNEIPLAGVLSRVAVLAKATLVAASEVSVTLVAAGGAYTAASTGNLARTLDEFQHRDERGPCLDAATTTSTFMIADTADDPRWPDYAKRAASAGVGSSLAVGLPLQEAVTGALSLYAVTAHAFDDDAVTLAQAFAGYAAVALTNAQSSDSAAALAWQMLDALAHRTVIEQAKGIVMEEQRCTADEASAVLSKAAQDGNRRLRDVAAQVVARVSRPPQADQ